MVDLEFQFYIRKSCAAPSSTPSFRHTAPNLFAWETRSGNILKWKIVSSYSKKSGYCVFERAVPEISASKHPISRYWPANISRRLMLDLNENSKPHCSKELPHETEARIETELEIDEKASMKTIDYLRMLPGRRQLLTCGALLLLKYVAQRDIIYEIGALCLSTAHNC